MNKIKVLVVDDSYFIRSALIKILSSENIEIIGQAKNGKEAVELTYDLKPDVITMDIEMPIMTGLEALKEIMEHNPTPVIMLSTLTGEGADATVEALSLGAVDFITKRAAFKEMDSIKDELTSKIIEIGKNSGVSNQIIRKRLLRKNQRNLNKQITPKNHLFSSKAEKKIDIIAIGISTGGPASLMEFIPELPANLPVPIMICQHMPPHFTSSLANRINSKSKLTVKEGESSDYLKPGNIYIAPGGKHMTINKGKKIMITDEPSNTAFKPSVDIMLNSIINVFDKNIMAIMMTGMGKDGSEAFKRLNSIGGYVIVQEPNTCVVSGMANAVIRNNSQDGIIELSKLAEFVCNFFKLKELNT